MIPVKPIVIGLGKYRAPTDLDSSYMYRRLIHANLMAAWLLKFLPILGSHERGGSTVDHYMSVHGTLQ